MTDGLFDNEVTGLVEVVRTSVSVHYRSAQGLTGAEPSSVCVCVPRAVKLPSCIVVAELPTGGPAAIGDGGLRVGSTRWVPRRWWAPPRPRHLSLPDRFDDLLALTAPILASGNLAGVALPEPAYDGLRPVRLVGAGPGLTPAGDDVLAGALVSAHALDDSRLPRWQRSTRAAMATQSTTEVSHSMLQHALDGYAIPELAGFLTAVCGGDSLHGPLERLLSVGHSSGFGLLHGVLHTLTTTDELQGAA